MSVNHFNHQPAASFDLSLFRCRVGFFFQNRVDWQMNFKKYQGGTNQDFRVEVNHQNNVKCYWFRQSISGQTFVSAKRNWFQASIYSSKCDSPVSWPDVPASCQVLVVSLR